MHRVVNEGALRWIVCPLVWQGEGSVCVCCGLYVCVLWCVYCVMCLYVCSVSEASAMDTHQSLMLCVLAAWHLRHSEQYISAIPANKAQRI